MLTLHFVFLGMFALSDSVQRPATSRLAAAADVAEVIEQLRIRDERLSNIAYKVIQTNSYTPLTDIGFTAWSGLAARFSVVRMDEKLALDDERYSREGLLGVHRSVWDGSLHQSVGRYPSRDVKTGDIVGTVASGTIDDSFYGHVGAHNYRMHHLLGIVAEWAYEEIRPGVIAQVPMTLAEYLESAVAHPQEPVNVAKEEVDGRQLLRLDLTVPYFPSMKETYWFDVERDFMPVRYESRHVATEDGKLLGKQIYEALDATRIGGVWVPTKIVLRLGLQPSARSRGEELYELSNIQLGKVKETDFKLDFPVGASVVDYTARVAYDVVDEVTVKALGFMDQVSRTPIYPSTQEVRAAVEARPPWEGFKLEHILPADAPPADEQIADITSPTRAVQWGVIALGIALGAVGIVILASWIAGRRKHQ